MKLPLLSFIIVTFSLINLSHCKIQCLDNSGDPVDWFLLYKTPNAPTVGYYGGYTYMYWDSNLNSTDPKIGNLNETNAVKNTVSQMWTNDPNNGYLFYNDQTYDSQFDINRQRTVNHPIDNSTNRRYAHAKGNFGFDEQTGFWLMHTVPGFPLNHTVAPAGYPQNNWIYFRAQSLYGQMFYCISVATSTINEIAETMIMNYPYIYDSYIPSAYSYKLNFLTKLANGEYYSHFGYIIVPTLEGRFYTYFAKSGDKEIGIYEDLVSDFLQSGLKTNTWCGGVYGFNCSDSYCPNPESGYPVVNVLELNFGKNLQWSNLYEHSKYAVGFSPDDFGNPNHWFCVADMNRQPSQKLRGGGALCVFDTEIWGIFEQAIVKYQECESQ